MKRLAYNAVVALALLAGYGCDRSASITDRHDKKTDDVQHPPQEAMAEAAAESGYGEDAAKPGVDNRVAQQNSDTTLFVVQAASGGMMEVALGKLALQKAASDEVKNFGQVMVTDHSKANTELEKLAGTKSIVLPKAPLPKHQKHIDHLSSLNGAEFDKAYMSMMVKDHQEDISKFQEAAKSQTEPEIKAFAQKTLPVLQKHLDLARKTKAKVQQAAPKAS